jgi:hypothetical protein
MLRKPGLEDLAELTVRCNYANATYFKYRVLFSTMGAFSVS